MSTKNYLNGLDYDQLIFARDFAQRLIDVKSKEKKKTLWRVTDGWVVFGNFSENDYIKAAELLLDKAKIIDTENKDKPNLYLESFQVRESEYTEYLN